jgi:hypothetical protein
MQKVIIYTGLYLLFIGWSHPIYCQSPQSFKVDVQDSCDHWKLCISAISPKKNLIKSITLLNDREEDLVDKPNSSSGYVSYGIRFDPLDDPDGIGEINYDTGIVSTCLTLNVQQPFNPKYGAYAAVLVVDNKGDYIVIELNRKSQPDLLLLFDPLVASGTGLTPLVPGSTFPIGLANGECTTLRIVNTNPLVDFNFNSLVFKHTDKNFKIICDSPLVGKAGDTILIHICCVAKDTLFHYTKFELSSECYAPFTFTVSNQDTNSTLTATDIDFGTVLLGETGHKIAIIKNIGSFPVQIGSEITFTNSAFAVAPSTKARLPLLLSVGDTAQFRISFSPNSQQTFTGQCTLPINMPSPTKEGNKPFSILTGVGVKPSAKWLSDYLMFNTDSNDITPVSVQRIYLANKSPILTYVESISFMLDSSSEFSITKNIFGYDSLKQFSLNPNDSIWVEITFKPDITKPYPYRYAPRQAFLAATYYTNTNHTIGESTLIPISGFFNRTLSVIPQSKPIIKAYIQDHHVFVNNLLDYSLFSLFDITGKKIYEWNIKEIDGNYTKLPLPIISPGFYLLRADDQFIPLILNR